MLAVSGKLLMSTVYMRGKGGLVDINHNVVCLNVVCSTIWLVLTTIYVETAEVQHSNVRPAAVPSAPHDGWF